MRDCGVGRQKQVNLRPKKGGREKAKEQGKSGKKMKDTEAQRKKAIIT